MLQAGEQGGKEAAGLLRDAAREYVQKILPDIATDFKIVSRVYARTKGLADAGFKGGIVDKPSKIDDFARGFTGSEQLFDFIDVGIGKDQADYKLSSKYILVCVKFNN